MASGIRGKVYIGKKRSRGVTRENGGSNPSLPGVKNIDATSGSTNKVKGCPAKCFSPMLLGPVVEANVFGSGTLMALNLENYWQYGKKFRDLGHENPKTWESFRAKGYAREKADRHPLGTKTKNVLYVGSDGKRRFEYLKAYSSCYLGRENDYISSRKEIYIPAYAALVRKTPAFEALKAEIDAGLSVMILDFDVSNSSPSFEVTLEFLRERVNDPSLPFGHGYVLAGLLAGIEPISYC